MKSHRFWIIAFWFYLGVLLAISISAYLKVIPTEIARFPYYDTVLHFVLLGIAAYLSHLALNKRQLHVLGTALPLAPFIVFLFCIVDIKLYCGMGILARSNCGKMPYHKK